MQAIIFDFDGTLADSELCSVFATQNAFQKCQVVMPSQEQITYYMGIPIEESFHAMSDRPLSDDEFQQLLTQFRSDYKQIELTALRVFPAIPDLLHALQQRNIACFVLSSKKSDVLYRNLKQLDIAHYFTDYIGSDLVTSYKPHPDGIFKLCEKHQLVAANCLMVGDAIFDIQMGHAAGTKTCAVSWGSHSKEKLLTEKPTFYIEHALDLLAII
ncbi:MAG: HAD family hydrolase [Kurthia sp.]|nr:HAD family hydrolase [Candidatus Kurthia equi]